MSKFAIAFVACLPLFCADAPLPKADTVLDHWVDATGGKAAWEKRHNVVQHGAIDFAQNGLKGAITIYEASPDKNLVVIDIQGIGKIESGSNGDVAWENSALQGPRIKQGVERTDALRDGTFNSTLYWRKLYAKVENAGLESVEGHQCYKIVLTPSEGQATTEFFDKTSGLLVKTAATRTTQLGDISGEILYEDYQKDGDGILSPHRLTNRFAQQEFQIQIQNVESNVDLPADRFTLPVEVQALVTKNAQPAPKPAAQ